MYSAVVSPRQSEGRVMLLIGLFRPRVRPPGEDKGDPNSDQRNISSGDMEEGTKVSQFGDVIA